MKQFLWLIFLGAAASCLVVLLKTGSMIAFGLALLFFFGMVVT